MNAGTACNADKGTVNENIILQDLNFNDGCIITFESSKFNEKLLKSRQNSKNPRDYISKLSKSDRWLMYLSRKLSKIELEVLNMEQIFAAASEQENTFFRNQKDYDAYLVQEIEESFTFESYFCMKFHAKFKIVFLFNEPFGLPRPLPASFRSIAAFWVDDRLLCGTGSE